MVSLIFPVMGILLSVVFAGCALGGSKPVAIQGDVQTIAASPDLTLTPVEASGIWFTGDTNRFLIISDETDRKAAMIFGMDRLGKIHERIGITGITEINDMEAIAADKEGKLHLLASQSRNKKGNLPDSRTLLLALDKTDKGYTVSGSIYLWKALMDAATGDTGQWASFVKQAGKSGEQDIEGMCFRGDTLLLGFKNPKIKNNAVILSIFSPDAMLDKGVISSGQVSLWRTLTLFEKEAGVFCGISDMCIQGNYLVGTATGVSERFGVNEDTGLMWSHDVTTGKTTLHRSFRGFKPEGITFDTVSKCFCIVFDNGSKNSSYFMNIKVAL